MRRIRYFFLVQNLVDSSQHSIIIIRRRNPNFYFFLSIRQFDHTFTTKLSQIEVFLWENKSYKSLFEQYLKPKKMFIMMRVFQIDFAEDIWTFFRFIIRFYNHKSNQIKSKHKISFFSFHLTSLLRSWSSLQTQKDQWTRPLGI